jgi:hypothetical protein
MLPRCSSLRYTIALALATEAAVALSRLVRRKATRGVAAIPRASLRLSAVLLAIRDHRLIVPWSRCICRASVAWRGRRIALHRADDATQLLYMQVSVWYHNTRYRFARHTEVHLYPTTCVQSQRGIASRTMLGFKFANVLVEARFVADVPTTELQYPLTAQRILQALLADTALHVDICALPPRPRPLAVHNPRHASGRARRRLRIECDIAGCEGLRGAGSRTSRVGTKPYKRHERPKLSTSLKEQVLWEWSPGAVNPTVLFVFFLEYLLPSRPSSLRFASTGSSLYFWSW